VAVCFDAPVVELFESRIEGLHPSLSRLGPDLLGADFDATEVLRRFRAADRADMEIGVALLDQRAMAGVGNIWKNETLWHEQVSPFRLVRDLDDPTLDRLVATARRLLRNSVGDGRAASPRAAYGRAGRPCRRCGTPIAVIRQGADLPRSTYWCPTCQAPGP
jgi:endonuclease-8